jgi:hypothetical protein
MSAVETVTELGQERLANCAFRVPVNGRLEPMCAVNALGLRDDFYTAAGQNGGANDQAGFAVPATRESVRTNPTPVLVA